MFFEKIKSKRLELKSALPKLENLVKTSIAFANGAGGRIIIGVDDKTHKVIGIKEEDRLRIYDEFANSLYDSASPTIIAQIYEQNLKDLSVLIIEILSGPNKPYFLKNKGISNGTYIRVGSSTRKATQDYIADLAREAQRITYDEEVIDESLDILSKDTLTEFIDGSVTKKRLLIEHIIKNKAANKEEFVPTVAGILMFCDNPHEYIPEAIVRCTKFHGTSGRDILKTKDIVGNVESQAIKTLETIMEWITTSYKLQGVKLNRQTPIPLEALREAIINALLHRKYNIPGAVKIAVYDDRIEIFSPGAFPGLVDLNNLGDGTTYLRNPRLTRLAYKANLIETRGTGIKLIFDSCRKAGIKKPEYHEEGDFVKVIFFFEPIINLSKDENDTILSYIKFKKEITTTQLANYLSVSQNTAIRKLNKLIKEKKVIKVGKAKSTRYILNR